MKKFILLLAAFAALVSCTKENPVTDSDETTVTEGETIEIGFLAYAPGSESETPESKSVLASNGYSVLWEDGDEVRVVFPKKITNTSSIEQDLISEMVADISNPQSSAYFNGSVSGWYQSGYDDQGFALYPVDVSYLGSKKFGYNLEKRQVAGENGSFGRYNLAMSHVYYSAMSSNKAKAKFLNACSVLKLTFPVDVASVEIASNSDMPLSGDARLGLDYTTGNYGILAGYDLNGDGYIDDALNWTTKDASLRLKVDEFVTANTSVVLSNGESGLQAGVTYNIVVWPGTHSSGLTFTFTDAEGKTCVKSTSQEVALEASKYDTFNFMSSFEFKEPPYLNINSTSLTAAAAGQNLTFDITSNAGWTVSGEDWMTFSPASGTGNATVTVTAAANNTASARSGDVTVTLEDGSVKTIAVSQNPVTYKVSSQYVAKAGDLKDGQMYAISNRMEPGVYLSENNGKLSTKQHTPQGTFSQYSVLANGTTDILYGNEVFIFKKGSKTEQPESYGSWSWGKIQSLSTGMYLDSALGLNSSSDNAQELVFANKWNNDYGELDGEIDIRKADLTVAFSYNQGLQWHSYSGNERFRSKWVFYEVKAQ